MHSKALSQLVDLSLDTMGMRGPISRREVAEDVLRKSSRSAKYWSAADDFDARMLYLQKDIAKRMGESLSDTHRTRYLEHVPDKYKPLFQGLTRFICITAAAGPASLHVMTIMATVDEWQANYELKDKVVNAVRQSRDHSRDVRKMLLDLKVDRLADL